MVSKIETMNKIISAVLVLLLLGFLGWWLKSSNRDGVFQSEREEVALEVSNKYMSLIDWPPKLEVLDEPFSCSDSGNISGRAGRSERRIIEGRTYCVTQVDEAAAGSLCRQYVYATEVEDKTYILTFSVRSSQCLNYGEETEQKECQAEQSNFNPDLFIHRLMEREITQKSSLQTQPESEGMSLLIRPTKVEQGDPALITINGVATLEEIQSLTLNGRALKIFMHEGKPRALAGFDLRGAIGSFPLELRLRNGSTTSAKFVVGEKYIAKAPLGIPDKLGGNTPQAEQELVNTLVEEGKLISAVPSASTKLWEGSFRLPIDPPITITDVYGYSRQTGGSSISHKGTDFRAAIGTPIYAMNSGVVRFTRFLRNYGNTVIVDHGLGLHTIYMHLSEINVKDGQKVQKGDLLGKSGDTGYVTGPHLHLTVRIGGISIDPEKFLTIFK